MKDLRAKLNLMKDFTSDSEKYSDDRYNNLTDEVLYKFSQDTRVNKYLFNGYKKVNKYTDIEDYKDSSMEFIEYINEKYFYYDPFVFLDYILKRKNVTYDIKKDYIDFTYNLI